MGSWILWGAVAALDGAALLGVANVWLLWATRRCCRELDALLAGGAQCRDAIVLGARVWRSGRPSLMLEDRLMTAASLYRAGCAKRLFVTGDDSPRSYHEVQVMAAYLIGTGVPEQSIVRDPHGTRTLQSMIHAHEAGIREAYIVTQSFHLPRAVWLARVVGIDAVGVSADRRRYARGPWLRARGREVLARLLAMLESLRILLRKS